MTSEPVADWAAARSDKWRRQLAGLEAMLAPIDEPLIKALALNAPVRVADVGCGGGATTIEVLRRAPAGSVAHGLDLSPALIEVARRRHGAHDSSVAFEVADMGTMAPPEPSYDRLISRLGVMFFNDPPAAFANLRRWLVPGGRFAFAVWGPVDDNAWMTATRAAVAEAIDLRTDRAVSTRSVPIRRRGAARVAARAGRLRRRDGDRLAAGAPNRRPAAGARRGAVCARLVLFIRGTPVECWRRRARQSAPTRWPRGSPPMSRRAPS